MKLQQEKSTVLVVSDTWYSVSFQIPRWAVVTGVYIPDVDAGALGLEWSDDDSNWYPILDGLDGSDAVICASGADAGYVDFSVWVASVHRDDYLRFTCASQTSGDVTMKLRFGG